MLVFLVCFSVKGPEKRGLSQELLFDKWSFYVMSPAAAGEGFPSTEMTCGRWSLLESANVQKEIGISEPVRDALKEKLRSYKECLYAAGRARKAGEQERSSDLWGRRYEELQESHREIEELLSESQISKLDRIERYLLLRREGAVALLERIAGDGDVEGIEQLQAEENQVWGEHSQQAKRIWQDVMDKVVAIVSFDSEAADYPKMAEVYLRYPAWADSSLFWLHAKEDAWQDPGLVGEKAVFNQMAGLQAFQYYPLDGNFVFEASKERLPNPVEGWLGFTVSSSYWETRKTGENAFGLDDWQFDKYDQILMDINASLGDIERRLDLLGDSKVDKSVRAKLLAAKHDLSKQLNERVWDEVLLPFQRAAILDAVRKHANFQFGPLGTVLRSKLPEEIKKKVRREFAEFEKRLAEIETRCYDQLLGIVNKKAGDHILDATDRPEYLRPSMYFIIKNANQPR